MIVMAASQIRKQFMRLIKNAENVPVMVVNNYKPNAVIIGYNSFRQMENEIKLLQLAVAKMGENK